MHNDAVNKIDALRVVLTRLFSDAAEAGLTKQDVMHAMLRHTEIIGEPNIPSLDLPEKAPEIYADRADKHEDPITFYNRVWKRYEPALYREYIERAGDTRLVYSMQMHCHRRGQSAEAILPPPIGRKVDDIVATWGADEREAARLWAFRDGNNRRRANRKKP